MKYFGAIKRFVIYPIIVGTILHYLLSGMAEMTPDNIDFPVITYYAKLFGFLHLSESSITALSFYFLGYGFGLLSTFLSVTKLRKGIFFSIFLWVAKVAFTIVNSVILPFVFAIDLLIFVIRMAAPKRKKSPAPVEPIYYEEKNAL